MSMMLRRGMMVPKATGSYVYGIFNVPTTGVIDTGVCLTDTDKDWAILIEVEYPNSYIASGKEYYQIGGGASIIKTDSTVDLKTASITLGIYVNYYQAYYMNKSNSQYNRADRDFINPEPRRYAMWHEAQSGTAGLIMNNLSQTITQAFTADNNTVHISPSRSDGMQNIRQVLIYNKALTATEISNYITNGIIP